YDDFTCFSKSNTEVKTGICKIMQAEWTEYENGLLVFTIRADRFLRNMVRAIVGTLLDVGTAKMEPEDVRKVIESQDRSRAGYSVPARGLFLHRVEYPDDIFLGFQSPGLAY
ncbi:MAG: tRNA pseudouridine(38-40) synthase TruA, partial [Bacteroidales bacterium]|nr:tRNA pseudouridine(38-40) synthase TruA [Bacteroidales bacterium]